MYSLFKVITGKSPDGELMCVGAVIMENNYYERSLIGLVLAKQGLEINILYLKILIF